MTFTYIVRFKLNGRFRQIFVAFLENLNVRAITENCQRGVAFNLDTISFLGCLSHLQGQKSQHCCLCRHQHYGRNLPNLSKIYFSKASRCAGFGFWKKCVSCKLSCMIGKEKVCKDFTRIFTNFHKVFEMVGFFE